MNHHFPSVPNIQCLFFWQETLELLLYTSCSLEHLAFSRKKPPHILWKNPNDSHFCHVAIEAVEEVMWPNPDQLEHHTPVIVQRGADHHQKYVKNAVSEPNSYISYRLLWEAQGHIISRIYQETIVCGMFKDFNFLRCPSSHGRCSWVGGDGTGLISHDRSQEGVTL